MPDGRRARQGPDLAGSLQDAILAGSACNLLPVCPNSYYFTLPEAGRENSVSEWPYEAVFAILSEIVVGPTLKSFLVLIAWFLHAQYYNVMVCIVSIWSGVAASSIAASRWSFMKCPDS